MITITLDIETVPSQIPGVKEELAEAIKPPANYKSAETIAKWWAEEGEAKKLKAWKDTSFDGALGHAAVIGYKVNDGETKTLYSDSYVKDEPAILRQFFKSVDAAVAHRPGSAVRIVGHRVLDFDLRFLRQRAVVLGVRMTPHIRWNAREWDDNYIFDTSFQWAGRDGVKLDKLCSVLGIAGKGEELGGEDIDGSKVWEYVERGEIAKVAKYCGGDVNRAYECYRRMAEVAGWIRTEDSVNAEAA